jgi:LEA14-like dessication related protein
MKKTLLFTFILMMASGCAALRDATDVREPNVTFQKMSVDRITFDGVTLLFDFNVENPNRFGVTAEKYNYQFFINDRSFLSGEQSEGLRVDRESSTVVQVPVTLNFSEVYETFGAVARQDSLSYALNTEVEFDLPVMGRKRVPVEAAGEIPVPRIPRISFGDIDVKELSLSGAEVEVSFRVANPNPFAISVENTAYQVEVNGREWLDTTLDETIRLSGREDRVVRIPIRLNSTQLGSALLEIMGGNTTFDYNVKGSAEVSAELEGFRDGQLFPFDLSGQYRLD